MKVIQINKVNEITSKELMHLMDKDKDNKIIIVDVRESEEVELGMIGGAIHIPLQSIPNQIDQLNKKKHYIFVCRSGVRSLQAAAYVSEHGIKGTNLIGGMIEWPGKASYYPYEKTLDI